MAGLLDALSGGGILDFLRANAMNQNAPGLQQSDTASYGSPGPMSFAPPPQAQVMPANQPNAIDSAAWPQGPVGAPMNANAAMPQAPQQPAPMSMAGPSAPAPQAAPAAPEGDGRFMLGLKGFLGNMAGGPIAALAGGLGAAVTGRPTDEGSIKAQQTNATLQALVKKGVDPAMAQAAAANPEIMKILVTNAFADKRTEKIKEYEYSQDHPDFKDAQAKDAKYGLTPIYGVGADGQPVAIQLNDKGGAATVKLPNGVVLSKAPIKVDTATGTVLVDPITRQPVAMLPKDIAGAARDKETGKAVGQAAVALPQVQAASGQILKTIGDIENHPGLGWSLGPYSKIPTIPGTQQANFRAAVEQLKGQTFLEAYNTLKGGGAITDIEGAKATNALARLDQAQSPEAFKEALSDFRKVIQAGQLRAAAKARMPTADGRPPAAAAADPLGLR
jgi:hypothetical protein